MVKQPYVEATPQYEGYEDTKGVIIIRQSKKNKQQHDQRNKEQKGKQRSTKHAHKTKDQLTRSPLKTGGELRCYGRVSSSCSTSGTRRVNLVTEGTKGQTTTYEALC